MGTDRRKQFLLVALLAVLAVLLYRAFAGTAPAGAPASNGSRAAAPASRAAPAAGVTAPDVHLDALNADRPKPSESERNLFRFRERRAPEPTGRPGARTGGPPPPPVPTGPAPPPPIGLKFIGIVEPGAGKPKIAVLSDGLGPPFYGVEGGVVAGRFRILRIGVESIEMAYLDGRGRQTIRLSGS